MKEGDTVYIYWKSDGFMDFGKSGQWKVTPSRSEAVENANWNHNYVFKAKIEAKLEIVETTTTETREVTVKTLKDL